MIPLASTRENLLHVTVVLVLLKCLTITSDTCWSCGILIWSMKHLSMTMTHLSLLMVYVNWFSWLPALPSLPECGHKLPQVTKWFTNHLELKSRLIYACSNHGYLTRQGSSLGSYTILNSMYIKQTELAAHACTAVCHSPPSRRDLESFPSPQHRQVQYNSIIIIISIRNTNTYSIRILNRKKPAKEMYMYNHANQNVQLYKKSANQRMSLLMGWRESISSILAMSKLAGIKSEQRSRAFWLAV